MLSKRTITRACTVATLALLLVPTSSSRSSALSPQSGGTARFVQIDNIEGFTGFFNLGQGTVRIVALLSPTCPDCIAGFREIAGIMEAKPTKRLRSYVVLMPIRDTDTRPIALTLIAEYQDRRASYFWDPNFAVGESFKSIVGSKTPVEDAYFVFDTDAVVREHPDAPSLWMRQHEHGDDPTFDGEKLEKRVQELLARLEEQQRRRATEIQE